MNELGGMATAAKHVKETCRQRGSVGSVGALDAVHLKSMTQINRERPRRRQLHKYDHGAFKNDLSKRWDTSSLN